MPCTGIDMDLVVFPETHQRILETVDRMNLDAAILIAEETEYRTLDWP